MKNQCRKIIIRSNFVFFITFRLQQYKSLEWRSQFKIDSVLNDDYKPPEVLTNYVSAGVVGQDKWLNPGTSISETKRENIWIMKIY